MGQILLEDIFINSYQGFFMKGFDKKEVSLYGSKYPSLFMNSYYDPAKLQIKALNATSLAEIIKSSNVLPEDKNIIQNLYSQNKMTTKEIKDIVCRKLPQSECLFDLWNKTQLKNLSLTSVGIVIGANRSKLNSGESFNMNIWI